MKTVWPNGTTEIVPDTERTLRFNMNEYRIERYVCDMEYVMGYGHCIWRAWAVTTYGAFCIAEGRNHDYVLKRMNEFIEAA